MRGLFLLLLLLAPAPALAGGNARVVDDAEAVDPGSCQIEVWGTRGRDESDIVATGACTPGRLPRLELGGFAEYVVDHGEHDLLVGPSAKYELHPFDGRFGVAIAGSIGFSLQDGRVGSAGLYVPISTDLIEDRLRLNLNAGWAWTRSPFAHEAMWGGQLVYAASRELEMVGELFGTSGAGAGWQAGLRWTPGGGAVDIDLLYRDDIDRAEGRAISLGIAVRR